MPVKSFFVPSIERLAAEMRQNRVAAAMNFALFHGQIDLISPRITHDRVDLGAQSDLQNPVENISSTPYAGATAFGRLFCFDNVPNSFVWRVSPHVEQHVVFFLRAKDRKLAQVEPDFLVTPQLLQID